VEEVHLTGAGDSHHAARAAVLAFESIARVACRPSSAHELAEYGAPALRLRSKQPLVVAASVSGRTPRVVTAIERACANGALTLAVTGTSDSPAAYAAHRTVVLELADLERSPGIRTYQATLLALLLTAIELGRARGACSDPEAETRRGELIALADDVADTAGGIKACCREVADTIAGAPAVVVAGSGPSFGTALFAAAKIVEASGVVAVPQDLEEWWHVERHAAPADIPTFVVAPPDRSHPRAAAVAAAAESLGRTVIAVVREGDQDVARHASAVVPVHGDVREELPPAPTRWRHRSSRCYGGMPPPIPRPCSTPRTPTSPSSAWTRSS
jgi:glucosamine--fructose-6-phosphate aminotransferase (isomerizing)